MQLNPDQAKAAMATNGPKLILAGPGTGKTTTLSARIKFLLVKASIKPEELMVLTFTRKAADEMRQRIIKTTGASSAKLNIGTFHGQALGLLKRIEKKHKLNKKRVVGEGERLAMCINAGIQFKEPSDESILEIIDRAKEKMQDSTAFEKMVRARYPKGHLYYDVIGHFRRYEKMMAQAGARDFNDILLDLINYCRQSVKLREYLGTCYKHILVDEFQDINATQMEILQIFTKGHGNIWAVGDDDQSLYGFRGADNKLILNFDKLFPGTEIFNLTTNYRSSPAIVALGNAIISRNKARYDKKLFSHSNHQMKISLTCCDNELQEADRVAAIISRLLKKDHHPAQMAVLSRSGRTALPVITALRGKGIPFHFSKDVNVNKTPAFKDAVRIMQYLEDEKLGPTGTKVTKRDSKLLEIANKVSEAPERIRFQTICTSLLPEAPFWFKEEDNREWSETLLSLKMNLKDIMTSQDLITAFNSSDEKTSVKIMPIHSAKGLEWSFVFLIGVNGGILPHQLSNDLEEERRVFYVGATRAKQYLSISYARSRGGYETGASPFIQQTFLKLDEKFYDFNGPDNENPKLNRPLYERHMSPT